MAKLFRGLHFLALAALSFCLSSPHALLTSLPSGIKIVKVPAYKRHRVCCPPYEVTGFLIPSTSHPRKPVRLHLRASSITTQAKTAGDTQILSCVALQSQGCAHTLRTNPFRLCHPVPNTTIIRQSLATRHSTILSVAAQFDPNKASLIVVPLFPWINLLTITMLSPRL